MSTTVDSSRKSIFISYVHDDADAAHELRQWLVECVGKKADVFLAADRGSLPLGSWWFSGIGQALQSANILLVMVSSATLYSPWVAFESGVVSGLGRPVIPILLHDVRSQDLAEPLRQRQLTKLVSPLDLEGILERVGQELGVSFKPKNTHLALQKILTATTGRVHNHALAAAYLPSRDDLYGEIINLVSDATQPIVIRATSTQRTKDVGRDAVYQKYLTAVAAKCAASASTGGSSEYTLVMSFEPDVGGVPPPDRQKAIRERCATFEKHGALECVSILQIGGEWALDVLTINDEHAVIGFPAKRGHRKLRNAVRISDRDFVRTVNRWYDRFVLPSAHQINLQTLKISRTRGFVR